MKKWIYYLCFIILLFLISIIPTSAKEFKTCTRDSTNLHVRDSLVNNHNTPDIMSTPCVDSNDKVYDYADLLTDLEEENLYNEIQNFIEKTGYDLAVATINENPKGSARIFADDFYDYNEFGKNQTRDGLLLLIDMDTREVYVSTTGYAILMYDEERIGSEEIYYNTNSVLDYGYNFIKEEKYYDSFSSMINRLLYFYNLDYPERSQKKEINEIGEPVIIKYISYPFVGFISGILTLIVSIIFYNISRLKIKVGSTISYMKNKNITTKKDTLVNSVVTHTYRSTDSGSGGSSGGSSYHSSSSGSFHGGGGRGF